MALGVKDVADWYLAKIMSDGLKGGIERFNCLLFVLQLPSICGRLEFPLYRDGELVFENVDLYNVPKGVIEEAKKRMEEVNKEAVGQEEVKGRGEDKGVKENSSACKEPSPRDKELYLHWLEKTCIASYVGQGAVNPQAFYLALYELRCSLTHTGVSYMTSGRVDIVRFIDGYNQTVTIGAELYIPFKLFCELMLSTASVSLARYDKKISPFDSILVSADFLSERINSDYCKALSKFDFRLPAWKRRKRQSLFDLYRVLTNCLGFKVCSDKQGKLGIRILEIESKLEEENIFISNTLITMSLTSALGTDSLRTIYHLCKAKGFEFIEGIQSKLEVDDADFWRLNYEKFHMWCQFKLNKRLYEEMISVMEDYLKFLTKLKEEFNEDFGA